MNFFSATSLLSNSNLNVFWNTIGLQHQNSYWNLLKMAISEFQKLKTRLNAKPFLIKEFYLHENLKHFHINCNTFVLSFTLKQRLWATRKLDLLYKSTFHKFLKVSEASFNAWGRAETERATKSRSYYKLTREKNDWHILCWERREMSLIVLLVNCHDVTEFLKWHNQPGKK